MSSLSDDNIVIRREGEPSVGAESASRRPARPAKPSGTSRRTSASAPTETASAKSTTSTAPATMPSALEFLPAPLYTHRHSIIAIMLFLTGLLSLIACVTYSPSDASGAGLTLREIGGLFTGDDAIRAKAETIQNWLGLIGAALSHFLYINVTGYSAIAYPLLLILWARSILKKNPPQKLYYLSTLIIGGTVILASFAGTISRVAWLPELPPEASGSIGLFISGILTQLIGSVGSFLFLTAATIIGLVLGIDLDIEKSYFRMRTLIANTKDRWEAFRRKRQQELAERRTLEQQEQQRQETTTTQATPPVINRPAPAQNTNPSANHLHEEPARLLRRRSESMGTAQDLNDILTKYARFDAEADAVAGVNQPENYDAYAPQQYDNTFYTDEEYSSNDAYTNADNPDLYYADDSIQAEQTTSAPDPLARIEPFEHYQQTITVEVKPHADIQLPPLQPLISQRRPVPPPPVVPSNIQQFTPESDDDYNSSVTTSPLSYADEELVESDTFSDEDYYQAEQSDDSTNYLQEEDNDESDEQFGNPFMAPVLPTGSPFAGTTSANAIQQQDAMPEPPRPPQLLLTVKQTKREEEAMQPSPAATSAANPLDEDISYIPPTVELLSKDVEQDPIDDEELKLNAKLLQEKLRNFNIEIENLTITPGPVVTQYEFVPAPGVKVSRIEGLADDIALALKARGIRIIAPVPGKGTVGVEIPNHKPQTVMFSSIVRSAKFTDAKQKLPLALGKTINGEVFCVDLAKMPHLLIAGSTGAGKSVGINTIIASLLFKLHPRNLKLMMVDPKKVEMSQYRALIDHFLAISPDIEEDIITTPTNAVAALNSVVLEMENRYTVLSKVGQRNIADYNEKVASGRYRDTTDMVHREMPYIVVIIDELADLMMTAGKEVEEPITRLAQLARAVGIHLVVATQRPSVDVITGLIKANFPARIAYRVASKIDSRTILDTSGAELLLGNGDMLFQAGGAAKPLRLQNSFISTDEVEALCLHISRQKGYSEPFYLPSANLTAKTNGLGGGAASKVSDDRDELFEEAARLIVRHQQGSVSLLQRRLKVGYARAARLVDQLEEAGIVGPFDGSKARQVLLETEMELEAYL